MSNTVIEAMYRAVLTAKKDSQVRQMFIAALKLKEQPRV